MVRHAGKRNRVTFTCTTRSAALCMHAAVSNALRCGFCDTPSKILVDS